MIFCYAVATAFLVLGLIISIYNIYLFIKICSCHKIPATIMDIEDNSWNNGRVRYVYKININGKEEIIDGPYNISFNPFISLISGFKIGKEVFVKYDKKRRRILPWKGNIILFFILGCILIVLSIFIYYLLSLLFM